MLWHWLVYQWSRAVWAFDHDGGVWVQGFAGIVSAITTIVLAVLTICSLRLTRRALKAAHAQAVASKRQAEQMRQQLLLMAHPNVVVKVNVDANRRTVEVKFLNRGAYPFVIEDAVLRASDDDGTDFEMPLREVRGATACSGDSVSTLEFLHERTVELHSGAFSDMAKVEFECNDTLGLIRKRYEYSNLFGLRDVSDTPV
jgi:hypothetical protein